MDYQRVSTAALAPSASLFTGGQVADLIALADLKLELNLSATTDDAYLQKLITRASVAAAKFCNRSFVAATWRDRIFPAAGPYPWQLPPTLSRLQLRQWPLTAAPNVAGTAPPVTPTLSAVSGGSLAATTYYARLTYVAPLGETAASLEAFLPVAANSLLQIAAPGPDSQGVATGYNVYLSSSTMTETKQAGNVAVGSAWTLPTSGLIAGATPPVAVTVVESPVAQERPLAEGLDFLVDAVAGQIDRLDVNARSRAWRLPTTVIYPAGYSTIPDDLQEAVILLAKMRYYARTRDPMVRSQNVEGVYSADYWLGTGIGGQGDLPVDVAEKLDRYRVTVIA